MSFYKIGMRTSKIVGGAGSKLTRAGTKTALKGTARRAASGGKAGNIQENVGLTTFSVGRGVKYLGRGIANHPEATGLGVTAVGTGVAADKGTKAYQKHKDESGKLKKNYKLSAFGIDHG